MKVVEEMHDGAGIVAVAGRLDSTTAMEFEDRFVTKAGTYSHVVVDCAELDFVSSAGLRVLLLLKKRLSATGGEVVLCAPTASVREVLDVSGLSDLLPMYDTRGLALEAIGH